MNTNLFRAFRIIAKRTYNTGLDLWYYKRWFGGSIKPVEDGAYPTQSTDYFVLSHVFRRFKPSPDDVLVDVGCGKGRVIAWWLKQGFNNKIIGVEINSKVAEATKLMFKDEPKVNIISGGAVTMFPQEGTLFYLFNPFDEVVMRQFKEKLDESIQTKITLIYYNCVHVEIFENDPNWKVEIQTVSSPAQAINRKIAFLIKCQN